MLEKCPGALLSTERQLRPQSSTAAAFSPPPASFKPKGGKETDGEKWDDTGKRSKDIRLICMKLSEETFLCDGPLTHP